MSDVPHTAIGSWSGYIYQGICAAYHVLKLYYDKGEAVKDYTLSLDSYEDFSIFDSADKIVSLHQCKCFADQNHDFSEEFKKMLKKRDDYAKAGICNDDAKLYFHTNITRKIEKKYSEIEKYVYHDNADTVGPEEIYAKIGSLVDKINTAKAIPVNAELLKARLSKWIDEHVFAVHQKYLDDTKANKKVLLRDYAVVDRIAFSEVINMVNGDGYSDVLSYEEVSSKIRLYYCSYLNERKLYAISHKKEINEVAIDAFMDSLMRYPLSKLKDLLIRLNPDAKVMSPLDLMNKTCGNNPSSLFNVIKFFEPVTNDSLHWRVEEKNESPSTLNCAKEVEEHCERIWENRTNLSVMYDYDWIVGDVSHTVRSIQDELNDVCDTTDGESSEYNIFSPRKTGILSINDKKNGSYN